jgi:hypothetical protein
MAQLETELRIAALSVMFNEHVSDPVLQSKFQNKVTLLKQEIDANNLQIKLAALARD